MKTLQTVLLAIALVMAFVSCQSSSSQTQILSDKGTRAAMMGIIASRMSGMIKTMMGNQQMMQMMQNRTDSSSMNAMRHMNGMHH